jgi:hypothetical protein
VPEDRPASGSRTDEVRSLLAAVGRSNRARLDVLDRREEQKYNKQLKELLSVRVYRHTELASNSVNANLIQGDAVG